MARQAAAAGDSLSIALIGNAAEIEPAWAKAGERFDVVTDQTSAHDALAGYVPAELTLHDAHVLRITQPDVYMPALDALDGGPRARDARVPGGRRRRVRLRQQPPRPGPGGGRRERVRLPGVRARRTSGRCSARARARSGGSRCPAIRRTSAAPTRRCWSCSRTTAALRRWLELAEAKVPFQGLPARICWLGYGERAKAGLRFNELVASGEVRAPIVIGRDHLDAGSVASPNRETEAMLDGSDAVADWPLLNALVNTAAGATWVSIHHGGGVGIGYTQHAGMVVVADGTELAARKLERVLTTDPGMGVVRHVDAGYERAIEVARERGVRIPMLED